MDGQEDGGAGSAVEAQGHERREDGNISAGDDAEDPMLKEEQEALGRILHALRSYSLDAEWEVSRWMRNFAKLSPKHQSLIPGHAAKCLNAMRAIAANQSFLDGVLAAFDEPVLVGGACEAVQRRVKEGIRPSPGDVDKVRYVLKNLVRDWAAEGAAERSQSYGRICTEIQERLPVRTGEKPFKVLVPGTGLGRLCYDLAMLGYETQGDEYSYYMLLTSSFVMNHTERAEEWTIYPWFLTNCNQLSNADQLRGVRVPDVSLREACPQPGLLSMCAGDFVEVYGGNQSVGVFDCVVTCFFLDCAHNIIEFIEIIHRILKEGGYWINLGPLLYHWADAHTYLTSEELSVELPLEVVEEIALKQGFKRRQRSMVPAAFNANLRSMLSSSYRCVFWTLQKETSPATS